MLAPPFPRPSEPDANYLFKKESEDQPLTQPPASRGLARPFHPPPLPCPPRPPAAPAPARAQLALPAGAPESSPAALAGQPKPWEPPQVMTGPRGPPRPPPDTPYAAQGAKCGVGEGRRGPHRGAKRGSLPSQLRGCGGPAVSGRGLSYPGVPARAHQHLSALVPPPPQVADQGQAAAAATAEALRQAGPKWCEPAELRRASGHR